MADSSDHPSGTSQVAAGRVRPAQGTVYAVVASDFDGDRFLVSLTDEVDDWVVEAENAQGSMEVATRGSFIGGWYPGLHGRPAWAVDRGEWRLHVGGVRITSLEPLPDRTVSPVDRHQATPRW